MSDDIKRYRVSEQFGDQQVTLEVNLDQLTVERATMTNQFLGDSDHRLGEENDDVIRAVIRLFGKWMINIMLAQGGATFTEHTKSPMGDLNPGPLWTADLHNEEGWGGTEDGNPFGWCGIRCVAADVNPIGYDDVQVEEVASA